MQAKKRYILVFVSCAFLAFCYFGGSGRLKNISASFNREQLSSGFQHRFSFRGNNNNNNNNINNNNNNINNNNNNLNDDNINEDDDSNADNPDDSDNTVKNPYNLPSFLHSSASHNNYLDELKGADVEEFVKARAAIEESINADKARNCRMEKCFDYSKCSDDFLVYVYPPEPLNSLGAAPPISANYQKILTAIRESRYYTTDPEKACLFVLGIDTLDRDSLSDDYVRNVPSRLARLPHWNNGRNHIIFNLYSGTWPHYTEQSLGFDYGEAILAKASMSILQFRPGFDVSIPLFHKQFPLRAGATGLVQGIEFPVNKKYLLAFKGKRYVHGIGSETRNALFHLHNARDIILVTTCRHGKSWRDLQDARCDEDNREYDRYDYETLLLNSTFCLVPRGRRLGSFRFLEALQAGCVPVLLSNGWVLPFESKIDWNRAVIWADERLLLQVPDIVRSVRAEDIFAMRQQTQVLWECYLSSIEKIVYTTFEIIRERLPDYPTRDSFVWNTMPGALLTLPTFADSPRKMPFLLDAMGLEPSHNYTAVIYVQIGAPLTPNNALYKLVRTITKSQFVDRILVLWANDRPIPIKKRWPPTYHIAFHVISLLNNANNNAGAGRGTNSLDPSQSERSISQRFYPYPEIETDAIVSLDEDAVLNTDELDFAYTVWRSFPDRIVGYPARAHFWDDSKNAWGYTSKWTNYYSIVLTGAAFYHRYYNYLYTNWLSLLLLKTVQQSSNCEDILMNLLVSHVTRKPPIKVTQRKGYKDHETTGRSPWNDPDHFIQRQSCLNTFAAVFGYMPLIRSNLRLDPVLYKDPVSNLRKKYRQLELIGS